MSAPNPLIQLINDRNAARDQGDPCANLCTAATVDQHGHPQARTLVLREIEDRLAVFSNKTSPKWPQMSAGAAVAIVVWLPSLQLQYRLACQTEAIAEEIVHESWQLRGEVPKRMDWYYSDQQSQGSRVPDRDTLLRQLQAVDLPSPLVAPATASGLYLVPHSVDRLDLNQPDGVHDRRRFELVGQAWVESILVP
jgi:pyridoxine/pyridoxamine 5'-phosphate oxidase